MMRSTWQSTDEYSIILSGLPFTEYPSQFQVVFLEEAIIGFHFNKNWNLGIQTHDFGLTLLSCQVVEWHRGMRRGGRGGSPLEETNFDRFYDSLIWCLLSLSLSLSLCRICPLAWRLVVGPLSPPPLLVPDGLIWMGGKWRQDEQGNF